MKKSARLLIAMFLFSSPALAADVERESIRLGELFCYTGCTDQATTWQNGWKLALEEVNAAGGINGALLEVISRDDKGDPAQATKAIEDLKNREKVDIVFGTVFSHTSLAASNFAKQNQMLFVRGFDGSTTLTGSAGHDRYFQIGTPRIVEVKYFAQAAAKSGKKRWAFVAPDYEAGHYYVDEFKKQLSSLIPDAAYIDPIWFPFGKLEAGAVAQAVSHARPDAIFFVAGGSDNARFVREGNKRNLFKNRFVIAPWSGMDPYISPLGIEAPEGWLTSQGYPAYQMPDAKQRTFINAYKTRYGAQPATGAYYAYTTLHVLAKAIELSNSTNPQSVAETMHTKTLETPVGSVTFRADGASDQGIWIGKTGLYKGKPTVLDAEYIQPDRYLPSAEENIQSRTK